jgi:hypothetical protein
MASLCEAEDVIPGHTLSTLFVGEPDLNLNSASGVRESLPERIGVGIPLSAIPAGKRDVSALALLPTVADAEERRDSIH